MNFDPYSDAEREDLQIEPSAEEAAAGPRKDSSVRTCRPWERREEAMAMHLTERVHDAVAERVHGVWEKVQDSRD